ncbi:hypothetical protein ECG_08617 [Echinococcus granulosus]|nr:hypothetical protein ECG_08617 [Echinococcus granulosus]
MAKKATISGFFIITIYFIISCIISPNSSSNLFTCLSFFNTVLFNPLIAFIEDACNSTLFVNLAFRSKVMDLSSGHLRTFSSMVSSLLPIPSSVTLMLVVDSL